MPPTPEFIDPMRESGIRLWAELSSKNGPATEVGMINDLLTALDKARLHIQGQETALSVYERRTRASKAVHFTEAETDMLRFALDAAQEVVLSQSGFSEEDQQALDELKRWAGVE